MGGGAFTAELLPIGAAAWCTGNKVIQDLNDLFFHPQTQEYKDAKAKSLAYFQIAASSGDWQHLLVAYHRAYDAAGMTICSGWSNYLEALGTLGPTISNGGNTVTTASTATSSAVLTFGTVPDYMAVGLNVSDSTNPGAINRGQTVSDFDTTTGTVTLTGHVNARVNSGDTIVFALPTGLGPENIKAIAQARYDGFSGNMKMKTDKHPPHDPHSSGHKVKVTMSGADISITSPFIPPVGGPLKNRKP